MKGLLYKELVVLRDSLRILGVVSIALLAMAMLSAASLQMIGSILSVCVVTLAVSSFSYDDLADWDIYAAAMPLRRWELVSAKYLLSGNQIGHVGVIGPERMDYKKVIKVLTTLGKMSETRGKKEDNNG